MRNGIVHVLRNITTCLVGITLIGCAGCGVAVDQQDTKQPTGSAGSDTSKSKIANSIPDYIDFLLDLDAKPDTKYPMSDAQKTILKRSRKSGSVSKPDYELAWSNYKQCVTGYGYTTPVLRQFSNGLYMIAMRDTTGMSDQQRKKFNEDENKCYNTEVIAVTGVYQMQIGNPGMLSDGDQAMVDCLHKAGIVPKNYDKEAYKKDLDAHAKNQPTTVDFSNVVMAMAHTRNSAPTSTAEKNATMIDEWKISKIGSFDRIANIRHGLDTKKLKRLSTIWALGPPMRIRAATYPTPITMPMTQKPSIAFNRPGIFPSLFRLLAYPILPYACVSRGSVS